MKITVKEAIELLKDANAIHLCFNGNRITTYCGTAPEEIVLDAWGNYLIDEIVHVPEDNYELSIACTPMKRGGQYD